MKKRPKETHSGIPEPKRGPAPPSLILRLHLIIAPHSLSICRRSPRVILALGAATARLIIALRLRRGLRLALRLRLRRLDGAVPSLRRMLDRLASDVVVPGPAALDIPARCCIPGHRLVRDAVVVGVGVFEDDVPGVQETGDVAETAQG